MNSIINELDHLSPSQITLVGQGQCSRLAELTREVARAVPGPAKGAAGAGILLVVSSSFERRPWRSHVIDGLASTTFQLAAHSGLPTPRSVLELAHRVRQQRPAVLLAIGGGATIDAAKSAAALAGRAEVDAAGLRGLCTGELTQRELTQRELTDRELTDRELPEQALPERGVPVVAVPTTPGTGAEVTPFATIWDTEAGRKLSLRGPSLLPAASVLDPDLLAGLPKSQLASCILDSFAQGIEANWSTGSNAAVERLSRTALGYLAGSINDGRVGDDAAQRSRLQLAGHLAGRAIAIAGTTLCHALSYPLTLRYGIPHGHACGLTLSRVLKYNADVSHHDCADPRGPERVHHAIRASVTAAGARTVADLAQRIDTFVAANSPTIDLRAAADAIAAEALSYDRAGNNPRRLDRRSLAQLLAAQS